MVMIEQQPKRTIYNMRLSKGADFNPVFRWLDEDGNAVAVETMTAELRIGSDTSKDNSDNYFTLTGGNGITLGPDSDVTLKGTISVLIDAVDTIDIEWEWAEYDLDLTDSLGRTVRLLHGKIYADNAVG